MATQRVSGSTAAAAAVLGALLVAAPAHAYLDPASGSLILQVLLGGVAGVALFLKLFWRKLLGVFGHDRDKKDESPR